MFDKLTNTIKSALAAGVMILLMIAFLMTGTSGQFDAFRGNFSGAVVTAGKHSVTPAEFKKAFDDEKSQAEQQYQMPISLEDAIKGGLDKDVLKNLSIQSTIREWLSRLGFRTSDKMLLTMVHKDPSFANPVTGQFDPDTYKRLLIQNQQQTGVSPGEYENGLKEQLATTQFAVMLQLGSQAPAIYASLAAAYVSETRDASYFVINEKDVPAAAKPTDEQLQAYLKTHASEWTRPEMRTLTVVRFDPKDFLDKVTVDPAAVQKQFDFKKESLSKPETRSVVQFPAKDLKAAADIAARLKAGADPVTLARATGAKAVTYDDKPKTAIPDSAVANAAFGLKEGEISGPVKTQFGGYVVLKVQKVTPGVVATLESARAEIETELKEKAAAKKAYEVSDAYETAHQDGAPLPAAARKAGVEPRTIGPVTANGLDEQAKPIDGLSADLIKTAFTTAAGADSDITESTTEKGVYFAVRVEKITPPTVPPLAEIREKLTKAIMVRATGQAMEAKAKALQARVAKGESIDAVAASAGLSVIKLSAVSRQEQDKYVKEFGREFTAGLLGQKTGNSYLAPTAKGIAVVRIDAIRTGDPKQMAMFTATQKGAFGRQLTQDISPQLADYSQAKIKPKIHRDLALTALGLDPKKYSDKPKTDKKAEKKK
ncbi:peptidyl-prolyl cis-trans isomerase D [Caulobacter ginsengisoli]|uniref:Parvulin-like PPIase n=1 Tax=Caulobacter ginsengisoli TaxID=400775 RepID=A0ABU0IM00_9CAUL|nr:peptidyl-prolyl cis-trans isomerase [Caulobacter ginsengisoli]MDQ0463046.1 peptidyl-prolyl cis-trans isomerase D [Caulobacter ginsengisoli]